MKSKTIFTFLEASVSGLVQCSYYKHFLLRIYRPIPPKKYKDVSV